MSKLSRHSHNVKEYGEYDTFRPLWRFEVGVKDTSAITVGDGTICLFSWHNKFVRIPHDGGPIRNDVIWCRGHERVVVEPLDDHLFALKSWTFGTYFSCKSDGTLVQTSSVGKDEKFALYFDYKAEHVGIFSTEYKKWVTAEPDGRMSCNRDHLLIWERFFGWKVGTKIAWSPVDVWEKLAEHDNTRSSWTCEFEYRAKIGFVQEETPSARLYIDKELVLPGPEMSDVFVAGIDTTTGTCWANVSATTWAEVTESTKTATAEPGSYTTVYQAVGKYGVFTFYSDHIRILQKT